MIIKQKAQLCSTPKGQQANTALLKSIKFLSKGSKSKQVKVIETPESTHECTSDSGSVKAFETDVAPPLNTDLTHFRMFHSAKVEVPTVKVKISQDAFLPGHVIVKQGTCVEWTVKDSGFGERPKTHVVSFLDIPEESQPLKHVGDSFRVTFSETGSYRYQCGI